MRRILDSRHRALGMRREIDRVLLKAIKIKAPKELITSFYSVRGSIDFWLEPPLDCWPDGPDEVYLQTALGHAGESLRTWEDWLRRQTQHWRSLKQGSL